MAINLPIVVPMTIAEEGERISLGVVTIRRRYNSNYSLTINSTYSVDVFKLTYPTGYPAIFDI